MYVYCKIIQYNIILYDDIVWYCTVLHCFAWLCCIVLYCTVLHCAVLCCRVMYCIVVYRILLYCIVCIVFPNWLRGRRDADKPNSKFGSLGAETPARRVLYLAPWEPIRRSSSFCFSVSGRPARRIRQADLQFGLSVFRRPVHRITLRPIGFSASGAPN